MAGTITLKLSLMPHGLSDLGIKSPIFLPGPVEPQFGPGRYLTFEGFSVDEHGKQHYMDATVAYRQTTLRVIEYLRRFGYDDYQVYLLLSCAPVQGHVAGIVDVRDSFSLAFFLFFLSLFLFYGSSRVLFSWRVERG
jgi:formamidase